MRRKAERSNEAIQPLLQTMRELRDFFGPGLEKVKARSSGKDAALAAFSVADLDRRIEDFERLLEANARWIEMADEFEAAVQAQAELAVVLAECRQDDAAPARANGGEQGDSAAPVRPGIRQWVAAPVHAGLPEEDVADIAAFERAYAETGNPLYVWDALSLLCVPQYLREDTPDAVLPGWCVDYLGRVAEALLGLPDASVRPRGGMAEQAPAVSKALGLRRQGWDAYAERRIDRDREWDADLYERVRAFGIPDKDAMEAAVERLGLEDERSVRRRLRRGRRAKTPPA